MSSTDLTPVSGWYTSENSAKARIRTFFSRIKAEKSPKTDTFPTVPADVSITASDQGAALVAGELVSRSRGTAWASRSLRIPQKDGKSRRSRQTAAWNPPPLIHAYTQAVVHEILDVPPEASSMHYREEQHSTSPSGNRLSTSTLDLKDALRLDLEELLGHSMSGFQTDGWNSKLFLLLSSGYLLQYCVDGFNDRLPEKLLRLDQTSFTTVCGPIIGKPYALRVSACSSANLSESEATRSVWAWPHARDSEIMCWANEIVLVFENAKKMQLWSTTIHNLIDECDGFESRPGTSGRVENAPDLPALEQLRSQKSFSNFSQSSPHLPISSSEHRNFPDLLPPTPRWALPRLHSQSTTASSIHTATDSDNYCNTSFGSDSSISTTLTSISDSFPPSSPAVDKFQNQQLPATGPSLDETCVDGVVGELPIPPGLGRKTSICGNKLLHPVLTKIGRDQPASGVEGEIISHDLFVQGPKEAVDIYIPPTQPASRQTSSDSDSNQRPISVLAPLPEPGHIRKTSARYRPETNPQLVASAATNYSRPPSSHSSRSSFDHDILAEARPRRSASYSLFPKPISSFHGSTSAVAASPPKTQVAVTLEKNGSTGLKTESLLLPTPLRQLDPNLQSRRTSKSIATAHPTSQIKQQGETNDETSRQPSQRRRTRAATAAPVSRHKLSGGSTSHKTLPLTHTSESRTEITTIALPEYQTPPECEHQVLRLASPPRKARHTRAQKSLTTIVPPSGPPPDRPLPALPKDAQASITQPALPDQLPSTVYQPLGDPNRHAPQNSGVGPIYSSESLGSLCNQRGPTPIHQTFQPAHTRTASSVSSVGSVRHVSAWLASPKVAAFSAKCRGAPRVDVGIEGSGAFGDELNECVTQC